MKLGIAGNKKQAKKQISIQQRRGINKERLDILLHALSLIDEDEDYTLASCPQDKQIDVIFRKDRIHIINYETTKIKILEKGIDY